MNLGRAPTEVACQSHREIYLPADLTRGLRAPRLTGQLSVDQALDRLLESTGLGHRVNASLTQRRKQSPAPRKIIAAAKLAAQARERGKDAGTMTVDQ